METIKLVTSIRNFACINKFLVGLDVASGCCKKQNGAAFGATPLELQMVLVVVVYRLVATETVRTEIAWLLTTGVKAMQFALVKGVDGCLVSIETIINF